jgi:hypothetical protein
MNKTLVCKDVSSYGKVPVHAMTACGGMEVWFHSFLTLAFDQWSTIFRKSTNYDQMLGARKVTQRKFHAEHPHSAATCLYSGKKLQ